MLGLAHIGQADPGRGNSLKEVGVQSAMLAGFLGALKDTRGQASDGAGRVEAPIAG